MSCAKNEAKFYMKRFSRGSRGKCILFKERWITPNEFQAISGRKSSKDWKRSIRLRGRCLKEFIAQGLFQEHAKDCSCTVCVGEDSELLRQEGEMALAAKKRRLSQADHLGPSEQPPASSSQPVFSVPPSETNDKAAQPTTPNAPPPPQVKRARGRPRKQPVPSVKLDPDLPSSPLHPPPPDVSRIWSPSGGSLNSQLASVLIQYMYQHPSITTNDYLFSIIALMGAIPAMCRYQN